MLAIMQLWLSDYISYPQLSNTPGGVGNILSGRYSEMFTKFLKKILCFQEIGKQDREENLTRVVGLKVWLTNPRGNFNPRWKTLGLKVGLTNPRGNFNPRWKTLGLKLRLITQRMILTRVGLKLGWTTMNVYPRSNKVEINIPTPL